LVYDIDVEAAQSGNVPVCIMPIHSCIMVAEHTVLQILALTKRLTDATAVASEAGDWGMASRRTDEDTFAYDWSKRRHIGTLYEKTVGILGFGEIGAELARRLRGFAPARILYHKRTQLPAVAENRLHLTYAPQDRLIAASEFLCNLLPYFPETDMLINADFLAQMKQGAFLVSSGSGSVIDEAALAEAVRTGHLAGAALDTYEWEPLRPDNPLLDLARDPAQNVLLTPHTAAGSSVSTESPPPRREDYDNIVRVLRGEPLLHRVV
jgi:lactate dehydrogenase-like 2-hydroxyacid dehydrogenase